MLVRIWQSLVAILWLVATGVGAADYQSHQHHNQSLVIQTDQGKVTLTAFNEGAIEVFYQPQGVKQLPSFAIAGLPQRTKVTVTQNAEQLTFATSVLNARIEKFPFRIHFSDPAGPLISEASGLFVQDTIRGFRFRLQEDEMLLGGGQRVLGMNRRGHRMPLYNRAHYGYGTSSNQMYYSLPAVMSDRHYALVFDNSARGNLDIGATEPDILQFDAVGGRTAYVVVAGQDYPQLIERFTQVTGRQPLPPRWALGNFASRFGYHTEQEVRDVVDKFRALQIPLDAVVLDLFWFGPDIKGHMGNLAWDRKAFPHPEKMMADLTEQGVKTLLITEPFVLSASDNWSNAVQADALAKNLGGDARQFEFFFGNTGLIDVFSQPGQTWFAQTYEKLFEQGVSGWWGDLGEPEVHPADSIHQLPSGPATGDEVHNAFGHQWSELVFDTQRKLAPDTRPMLLMRAGFVGTQRFGIMPWTGDVSRSWDGLKPQVELSLQMSMFGLAYTHSDLGGFAGGEAFDKEMYIRWLQYGVFQPVYRPHAQENIAPEPVFHDTQTQDILRRYINLRYQLLPYNYSLAYENSLSGMPLMRPMMFFEDLADRAFEEKDQYMWGDAFLVKPVTDPSKETVDVTLPSGVWFDFWSDQRFDGGQQVNINTSLEHLPVLVKGGAFVPMVDTLQSTQEYSTQQMYLHYYSDPSIVHATGTLYDDDGVDPMAIERHHYQTLSFSALQQGQKLELTLQVQGDYSGAPTARQVILDIHNWSFDVSNITVDGLAVEHRDQGLNFAQAGTGFHFDKAKSRLKVKLTLSGQSILSINEK